MTKRKYTLAYIAELTKSTIIGNPDYIVENIASIDKAGSLDISFLENIRYSQYLLTSKAGALFVKSEDTQTNVKNLLINNNPSFAIQVLIDILAKDIKISYFEGIHPTAVVHPSVILGSNIQIGPNAVIDGFVKISDNSFIGSGCYIGPHTTIGSNCIIHPNVTIRENCIIGNNSIIQPGAVLGACGFGFYTNKSTGKHSKLNHIGSVVIESDVEVGANTTIDRSRFTETKIGQGSKLDNLIQIGHAVEVGKDNLIVAQVGIAGSTKLGNNVILAGQVGLVGHISISDNVMIGAQSGVSKSIKDPGSYSGTPAIKHSEDLHNKSYIKRIPTILERLSNLEEQLLLQDSKIK